jgi:hypothetical protein
VKARRKWFLTIPWPVFAVRTFVFVCAVCQREPGSGRILWMSLFAWGRISYLESPEGFSASLPTAGLLLLIGLAAILSLIPTVWCGPAPSVPARAPARSAVPSPQRPSWLPGNRLHGRAGAGLRRCASQFLPGPLPDG